MLRRGMSKRDLTKSEALAIFQDERATLLACLFNEYKLRQKSIEYDDEIAANLAQYLLMLEKIDSAIHEIKTKGTANSKNAWGEIQELKEKYIYDEVSRGYKEDEFESENDKQDQNEVKATLAQIRHFPLTTQVDKLTKCLDLIANSDNPPEVKSRITSYIHMLSNALFNYTDKILQEKSEKNAQKELIAACEDAYPCVVECFHRWNRPESKKQWTIFAKTISIEAKPYLPREAKPSLLTRMRNAVRDFFNRFKTILSTEAIDPKEHSSSYSTTQKIDIEISTPTHKAYGANPAKNDHAWFGKSDTFHFTAYTSENYHTLSRRLEWLLTKATPEDKINLQTKIDMLEAPLKRMEMIRQFQARTKATEKSTYETSHEFQKSWQDLQVLAFKLEQKLVEPERKKDALKLVTNQKQSGFRPERKR